MKQVGVYARVSGDSQEREETIASQLEKVRALAAEKHFTVLERHIYLDDGFPGEMLARPGLDRLRDDARDGLLDVVLVHCPDRLARRYAYQVVIIEELQKYGCEVYFVNRPIVDTPEDQMLLAMQGVIAEYERAKIMERTRRGRLYKARLGMLVSASMPYGYRYIPRRGAERARAEIVPEQAAIVRHIFRWLVEEGLSILAICRRLRDRRVPSPRGRLRWGSSTVQKILRNRAYIGEYCVNRLMSVEPTVPPRPGVYRRKRKCVLRQRPAAEWIVIPVPNDKLAENRRFALRHAARQRQTLLRCLVRCGACGHAMPSTSAKPIKSRPDSVLRYYKCGQHAQPVRYRDSDMRCPARPVKVDVLDEIVWNDLRALLSDPDRIAQYAGLNDSPDENPLHAEIEGLQAEVADTDRQLERLVDAYQRGAIEIENLVARRHELTGRKSLLTESLRRAETVLQDAATRHALRAELPELVRLVQQRLHVADFGSRQELVRSFIDRVMVMPDRSVEIHYRLPVRSSPAPSPRTSSPDAQRTPPLHGRAVVSGDLRLHPQRQQEVFGHLVPEARWASRACSRGDSAAGRLRGWRAPSCGWP
jgi:site-specific DNA recombinase